MRRTGPVFHGLSAHFLLVGLAVACVFLPTRGLAAPKKHPRFVSEADKQLRKQGYRTRDEVVLPPMATPFMASGSEPIGGLEVPGAWAYSPGKPAASKPAAGGAAEPSAESASSPGGRQWIALPKVYGGWPNVVFSTPLPKHAVVFEYNAGGTAYADTLVSPTALRVFDLATGQQVGKVRLPPGFQPLALSEDGSRVLLQWTWKQLRLDVFDFGTREHIVGWRPYPDNENDPHQYRTGDLKADLAFARFVDNDRVVTFHKKGLLSLWNIPKCERIYQYTGVNRSLGVNAPVTADGRAVLLPGGDLFHLADGKILGRLAGYEANAMRKPAISPDGTRLAASKIDGDNSELTIWDLATGGKISSQAEQPVLGSQARVVLRELPVGAGKLPGPEDRKSARGLLPEGCQVGAVRLALSDIGGSPRGRPRSHLVAHSFRSGQRPGRLGASRSGKPGDDRSKRGKPAQPGCPGRHGGRPRPAGLRPRHGSRCLPQ